MRTSGAPIDSFQKTKEGNKIFIEFFSSYQRAVLRDEELWRLCVRSGQALVLDVRKHRGDGNCSCVPCVCFALSSRSCWVLVSWEGTIVLCCLLQESKLLKNVFAPCLSRRREDAAEPAICLLLR